MLLDANTAGDDSADVFMAGDAMLLGMVDAAATGVVGTVAWCRASLVGEDGAAAVVPLMLATEAATASCE